MKYLTFVPDDALDLRIAFLVPTLNQKSIARYYLSGHLNEASQHVIAYDLHKGPKKKTPMVEQKEYLSRLLPTLRDLGIEYLVVCDADYFKALTKGSKAEANLGYVLESQGEYKDGDGETHSFEGFKVLYCPNHASAYRDEDKVIGKINQCLDALVSHIQGTYVPPGNQIISSEEYPTTVEEIGDWLQRLTEMDCDLTADIETFSLKHYDAGIGTISFAWDRHNGIAFGVDLVEGPGGMPVDRDKQDSRIIREMLRDFFVTYSRSGKRHIWHNISFDVYVLIYQLFMDHILDTEGLLNGLNIMLAPGTWEDTKLITYLATNSCAGNELGLKAQAQGFAGNYAVEEIKDIRLVPFKRLLRYNLVDCLSTWFVYHKHWKTMVRDQQLEIYRGLFQQSTIDIIQMQLTGLPLNMDRTLAVNKELLEFQDHSLSLLLSNPLVEDFLYVKRERWIASENARLVRVQRDWDDAKKAIQFNPNSNPDLQELLYGEQFMGLPVMDRTESKAPATGGETLEKLVNHTERDDVVEFLQALIDYKAVNKLITSFLPAMRNAQRGIDGWHYLFGNFNLGGTVSGRLSSSGPNLQNLPSNVAIKVDETFSERYPLMAKYVKKGVLSLGKVIKSCFEAPPGFLFVGLDFASLEDRISALQTKDPEKLKVYLDGYDGHCLRAYTYFSEQMSDNLNPDDVESINSIKDMYPHLRQEGKTPTFLMTYQGTWHGIVHQLGWDPEKAQKVESRFKELYKVSVQWVSNKIQQACHDGYVTGAFGLRVRTPLLAKTYLGTRKTPKEAEGEGRTAGNALGQSYCMLNSRAGNEFMGKVRLSEYSTDIRPCAHIHDAQYFIIPEDMAVLLYMNEHLVKAVEWQDDPEIWHDEVKLGGEVSIFFPTWAEEMEVPNGATEDQIKMLAEKHLRKYELI